MDQEWVEAGNTRWSQLSTVLGCAFLLLLAVGLVVGGGLGAIILGMGLLSMAGSVFVDLDAWEASGMARGWMPATSRSVAQLLGFFGALFGFGLIGLGFTRL